MSIEDSITRRAIFIQRFADGNADVIADKLVLIRDQLTAKLLAAPDFVRGEQLTVLINDIDLILSRGFENAETDLFNMLLEFSEDEAEFNKLLMDMETKAVFAPLTTPQLTQTIRNQVMTVPVGTGTLTITQAARQFSIKKSQEIMRAMTDGFTNGSTTSQIAKEVADLMDNRQARQAKTLVRTTTNAASNLTRNAFFASNTGLIQKYEWVATLDGRTTLICAGRDGNKYKVGKGPLPPAHWACRSTVIPIVREDLLVDDEADKRPENGAEGPGTTTASTTYQEWLKRQPASFQDEVLGRDRAKLFREGGLEVRQFRDELGRTYTLEQLRLLQPMAFEKANID